MSQAPLRPHFPEREATKIQKKITKGKLKWDNEPVRSQETLILEILSQIGLRIFWHVSNVLRTRAKNTQKLSEHEYDEHEYEHYQQREASTKMAVWRL